MPLQNQTLGAPVGAPQGPILGHLPLNDFATVVRSAPLVSIDLVVVRNHSHILLGQRSNRPAQGYWFVPGGRIYKNETMQQATQRIAESEIGITPDFIQTSLKPQWLGGKRPVLPSCPPFPRSRRCPFHF